MAERCLVWCGDRRLWLWWVVSTFVCTPAFAQVPDSPQLRPPNLAVATMNANWRITLGANLTTFDTSAAWAPRGLAGAAIVLEDALGLDERMSTVVVAAEYRFNRKHSLSMSVTELGRTATRTLDEEIEWGDYVFRASGTVAADLETTVIKLAWKYDFSDSDRLNAGFLAGLSTFDLGLTLSGEARLETSAGDEWVEGVVEGASAVAPVPVIGFYLDYALSSRWVLRFDADLVDLSIGSHSGRVLEAGFAFEVAVARWLVVGVGLGGTDIEYQSDEGDEKWGLRYRFSYVGGYASIVF